MTTGHSACITKRLIAALFAILACGAASSPETKIELEKAPSAQLELNGPLGTAIYTPTRQEEPFLEKTPISEQSIGSVVTDSSYDLAGHRGKWISWFGIVRSVQKQEDGYELLVEHKFFDGLTDLHILALSFNGAGDFKVNVHGAKTEIHPLELIRVYGTVSDEKVKPPTVHAEYIRVFPWKTFTFLACYGHDLTNPAWRKLCKVPLEGVWSFPVQWSVWHFLTLTPIYDSLPDEGYYRDRLGDPADGNDGKNEESRK